MKAASKYVDVPVSATEPYMSVCVDPSEANLSSLLFSFLNLNSQRCLLSACSDCLSSDSAAVLILCCAPQKPGMDVADGYVTFVRHSQDMLRDKVNEEVYIERLFDVSKMPSPPHNKREGPSKMWQNSRAERDKSILSRKCSSNLEEEAFFDPLPPLDSSLLFLSLFSLNFSCCPLHSGVRCHTAFGPLCI